MPRNPRRLTWPADAVLGLLFAAGYAARYVPPEAFWGLQLVATCLPFLAVLVVVRGAFLVWRRRWGRAAVAAVLLLLFLVRLVPRLPAASPAPADAPRLDVLTINIPYTWIRSGPDLMRLFQRIGRPDLLCLQDTPVFLREPGARPGPPRLWEMLVDSLGYHTLVPEGAARPETQLPVFSRAPLEEVEQFILRTHAGDEEGSEVVRATMRWEGREVVVYNLHLRSYGARKPWKDDRDRLFDPRVWLAYLRQYREAYIVRAREAERVARMLAAETAPLLVCGDFNSTPHHWVYARLREGLRDAYRAVRFGGGATFHAKLPLFRIDYVLAGPQWFVEAADVYDAPLSDHRPLRVRLALRPAP